MNFDLWIRWILKIFSKCGYRHLSYNSINALNTPKYHNKLCMRCKQSANKEEIGQQ